MKKILFVCKHNVFRSRVAEEYFNKINKNKNWTASSAGIIKGDYLTKEQKRVVNHQKKSAGKIGIKLEKKLRGLKISFLRKQEIVIIVADDVPKIIFNNKSYIKKAIVWKIKDADEHNGDEIDKTIKSITKKVDGLIKRLK